MSVINEKKFRIYRDSTGKTIAVTRFAGKNIRGVAKRNPADVENAEIGKKVALLRCAEKVADKRMKNAQNKVKEAALALEKAQKHYEAMLAYQNEAMREHTAVQNEMKELFLN